MYFGIVIRSFAGAFWLNICSNLFEKKREEKSKFQWWYCRNFKIKYERGERNNAIEGEREIQLNFGDVVIEIPAQKKEKKRIVGKKRRRRRKNYGNWVAENVGEKRKKKLWLSEIGEKKKKRAMVNGVAKIVAWHNFFWQKSKTDPLLTIFKIFFYPI